MRNSFKLLVAAFLLSSPASPAFAANEKTTVVPFGTEVTQDWFVIACHPGKELTLSHRVGIDETYGYTESVRLAVNDSVALDVGVSDSTVAKLVMLDGCTGTFWIH
jgi:hypothetical protein